MNSPMADSPDFDQSQDYVVTYPGGAERVLWGEQAALNEAAAFPGSKVESYDAYTKRKTTEAKKASKSE